MNDAKGTRNSFYCVREQAFTSSFPPTDKALSEPDGLLAIGGKLDVKNLLEAYKLGIFPWYSEENPVMWWSPKIRPIIRPHEIRISKSLKKTIKKNTFDLSYDKCFKRIMQNCSTSGDRAGKSWITSTMIEAYTELHALGHAHSVECWQNGELCGGLYGVSVGRIFYGESMFSKEADASKVALVDLCAKLQAWGYLVIDCQIPSPHLNRLGAKLVEREQFEKIISQNVDKPPAPGAWNSH